MKPLKIKINASNRKRIGMGIVARIDAIAAAHLDSSAKSLLIMLAKHLRTETAASGGVAWPSLKTLAAQAGMSEDTASRTMGRLEKSGIVVTVSKAAQGRSARRAIDWTALASSAPRMRVQGTNLLKGQRSEDAGSSAPRMRVLDSASSETQNPEARGGSVQGSEEGIRSGNRSMGVRAMTPDPHLLTALLAFQRSDPTMHTLIADDIRRRHNLTTDSRPTMDADPIDNDGAATPSPFRATPSPTEVSDAADLAFRPCSFDGLRSDGGGDVRRSGDRLTPQRAAEDRRADQPVAPGQHVREPGAVSGRPEAPGVEAGDPRRAAGDASTLSPAPATSETSAAPDPDKLWSLQSGDGAAPPPAKPKRKAKEKTETDAQRKKRERAEQAAAEAETMLAAWGQCCQSYDTISGKVRRWDPAKGDGRLIAETMAKEGQARIVARFAQAARDPWCLEKRPDLSALCRGSTPFVSRLDAAAEQATLDAESRSGEPQAVGGVVGRSESQNAQERQPAPKQTVSWPDVLRDLGSDPDHHPDDGPLREHWPKVRQAIYIATKSAGDAWLTYCNADDRVRVHVQRLLSIRVAA